MARDCSVVARAERTPSLPGNRARTDSRADTGSLLSVVQISNVIPNVDVLVQMIFRSDLVGPLTWKNRKGGGRNLSELPRRVAHALLRTIVIIREVVALPIARKAETNAPKLAVTIALGVETVASPIARRS